MDCALFCWKVFSMVCSCILVVCTSSFCDIIAAFLSICAPSLFFRKRYVSLAILVFMLCREVDALQYFGTSFKLSSNIHGCIEMDSKNQKIRPVFSPFKVLCSSKVQLPSKGTGHQDINGHEQLAQNAILFFVLVWNTTYLQVFFLFLCITWVKYSKFFLLEKYLQPDHTPVGKLQNVYLQYHCLRQRTIQTVFMGEESSFLFNFKEI